MSAAPFPVLEDGAFVARASARAGRFGVLDTLLVEDGRAWFVERHMARLARDAQRFGIDARLVRDAPDHVARVTAALGRTRALVRTTAFLDALGPRVVVEARAPRDVPAAGVEVVLLSAGVDPLGAWKTTRRAERDRLAAAAERAGVFEALLVRPGGTVVDAARANVVARVDGQVVTPPGALAGVVRGLLQQEMGALLERALDVDQIARADEVLLTASGIGVAPVRAIHGLQRRFPGPDGDLARAARAALRRAEAAYARETR